MQCHIVAEADVALNPQKALVDAESSSSVGGEDDCAGHGRNSMVGVDGRHVAVSQNCRVPDEPTMYVQI